MAFRRRPEACSSASATYPALRTNPAAAEPVRGVDIFVASFRKLGLLWVMKLRSFASLVLVLLLARLASAAPAQDGPGWVSLFDGKTSHGWRSFKKPGFPDHGWQVEEGWLHCLGKNGGDIITDQEFENFELEWDWKQAPGGNSGLKYFITEKRASAVGHEYQLIDEAREPDAKLGEGKRVTAAFYDVLKPAEAPPTKPAGEINHSKLVVRGNHVQHWLNGAKVLEYDCGSEALKAAVAESKFKNVQGFGEKIKGHILLQDHHSEAWFRNIRVHELGGGPPKKA